LALYQQATDELGGIHDGVAEKPFGMLTEKT